MQLVVVRGRHTKIDGGSGVVKTQSIFAGTSVRRSIFFLNPYGQRIETAARIRRVMRSWRSPMVIFCYLSEVAHGGLLRMGGEGNSWRPACRLRGERRREDQTTDAIDSNSRNSVLWDLKVLRRSCSPGSDPDPRRSNIPSSSFANSHWVLRQ